ncbi:hypothetical protein [Pseudanabaena sp. PCC 6802]|nr:hypothetical protein [Pseudanabaena sp. PCC 6802]
MPLYFKLGDRYTHQDLATIAWGKKQGAIAVGIARPTTPRGTLHDLHVTQ